MAMGSLGSSSERSMISTTYFLLMELNLISSYKYKFYVQILSSLMWVLIMLLHFTKFFSDRKSMYSCSPLLLV